MQCRRDGPAAACSRARCRFSGDMTRAMGIGIFAAIVCAVGAGGATAALSTSSAAPAPQRAPPAAARDPFGAELAQRLDALLSAALGPGQARISVNVVLD